MPVNIDSKIFFIVLVVLCAVVNPLLQFQNGAVIQFGFILGHSKVVSVVRNGTHKAAAVRPVVNVVYQVVITFQVYAAAKADIIGIAMAANAIIVYNTRNVC
jgi:hypothetical protein